MATLTRPFAVFYIRDKPVIFPLVVRVHELQQIGELGTPAGLLADFGELALAVDNRREQTS